MTTPMRRQYLALKKQYPDVILFFRLGDFYETFDDDARIVARVCDVVLTSRPVGNDLRVPLAGVPYHAIEGYVAKLLQAGYKVALADQMADEAVNGLVPRAVQRVITPGTIVEASLLDERRNNYLIALCLDAARAGLAYCDITTGEFAVTQIEDPEAARRVQEELSRLQPAEIVLAEGGLADRERVWLPPGDHQPTISPYAPWHFDEATARQALLDQGRLVKVSDEVAFAPAAYAQMVAQIREFLAREGSITVAQARDLLQTSRKYALALLEHLDAQRVTRHVGDTRVLRERA